MPLSKGLLRSVPLSGNYQEAHHHRANALQQAAGPSLCGAALIDGCCAFSARKVSCKAWSNYSLGLRRLRLCGRTLQFNETPSGLQTKQEPTKADLCCCRRDSRKTAGAQTYPQSLCNNRQTHRSFAGVVEQGEATSPKH